MPREQRIRLFREKMRNLSTHELKALALLLRRNTDDLVEELQAAMEEIASRRPDLQQNRLRNGGHPPPESPWH
jgi:hypothetical protein